MTTPFQDFVNTELPKRPSTQDSPISWSAGQVLMATGVGLCVEAVEFAGGEISGSWDMTPVGSTLCPPDDLVNGSVSGSGPYTLSPTSAGISCISSSSVYTIGSSPAQFHNYASGVTQDPYFTYFGFISAESTAADIVNLFMGVPPAIAPLVLAGSIGVGTDDTYQYIKVSTSGQELGIVTDGQPHTSGQLVQYQLSQSGSSIRLLAKVESDTMFRLVCEGDVSLCPSGMKPFLLAVYFVTPTVSIDNILMGGSPGVVSPPIDPVGKRYIVSAGGIFSGETAETGDIVEFLSVDDIFVTRDVNLLISSLPTASQIAGLQSSIGSLDTRVSTVEDDVSGLQGQVSSVFKDGRLVTESLACSSNTPFEYFLGSTLLNPEQASQAELKVFTWDNAVDTTSYEVFFYKTPSSGDHSFYFKLVLPDSNAYLSAMQRYVRVSSVYLDDNNTFKEMYSNVYIDARRLKYVYGVYRQGMVSFIGHSNTYYPLKIVQAGNPAAESHESVGVSTSPTVWNPWSGCVDSVDVIALGGVGLSLQVGYPAQGDLLGHIRNGFIRISISGSSYGLASISVDGISIPDVPVGETHTYMYNASSPMLVRTVG